MSFGAVLIFSALLIFLLNNMEAKQSDKAVEKILPEIIQQIENPTDGDGSTAESAEIDGYSYVGYLYFPSLDMNLPVMAEWDMARMKIAPCLYFGSKESENMVIAGHNYAKQFGRLSKLKIGDIITFTDIAGNVTAYSVYELEVLPPTAVEDMISGEASLTMFTCTYGGKTRFTVRCELAKN